ncbi:MAG: hypothetical protein IKO07_06305 [Clostridia bacterium]|nr:hypothetical protein [Clostridia bacterium]
MDNEDRYAQIESALLGVTLALEGLVGTDMDDAVASLREAKERLEHELERLDKLLEAEDAANLAAMNREYERSVL